MLARPVAHDFMAFHPYHEHANHAQLGYDARAWSQDLPLQRPYAKSVGSYSGGLTYAQHELLRQRKTPQGRVCEVRDIANIDASVRLPASKHVLLTLPHNTNAWDRPRNDLRPPPSYERQNLRSKAYSTTGNAAVQPAVQNQWAPAWCFPGGYDSTFISSESTAAHRAYFDARSQIPTVMPSVLQNSFGPTASAGQQYYGPYWPDGTFSPYRPAPTRDDRFFHWRHSRDLSRDIGPSFSSRVQMLPGQAFNHVEHQQQASSGPIQGVASLQSLPPRDAYAPYPSFHDRISNAVDPTDWSPDFSDTRLQVPGHPEIADQDYHDQIDPAMRPTIASERLAYRDRTFSWAYRVYIELLAQIQREAKAGQQHTASGPRISSGSPSIYPRPPQRANPRFPPSLNLKTSTASPQFARNEGDHRARKQQDILERPSTAIYSPRRMSEFGTAASRSDHFVEPKSSFNQKQPLNGLSIQQDPTRFPRQFVAFPDSQQSLSNALSALDAIESLCRDDEAQWTDGMLLAGCLAYGVGNYNRAQGWYQKVLDQDHRHVEAMSNLAATILALGRKDEAVNRWTTAIKLRPSYFEAVEHLVGLFVSSHRTEEAVEIIEYIETRLRLPDYSHSISSVDEDSDSQSRASSGTISSADGPFYEYDAERRFSRSSACSDSNQAFGASGYAIPAVDNGRLLALVHAKGNMLYSLGKSQAAAVAFEEAILIATGTGKNGIKDLIERTLRSCVLSVDPFAAATLSQSKDPVLLTPERAQQISARMFPPTGDLPGLECVPSHISRRAAISTTSNSLLSLAKIYQDGLCSQSPGKVQSSPGTREILALYYLSLSLQPSPSTANNVGILLASVQSTSTVQVLPQQLHNRVFNYTGVVPGSGVALALAYYNYGLNLDGKHAHLYTNLGSLLKDLGELPAAIKMYETAVSCDPNFDIALANLANAVKDQGRITDAIGYYKRAVASNPDFAEAVCGLATALNSVCDWYARGGVYADGGTRDSVHVDEAGMMHEARKGSGWMNKVVEIVDKQLRDGENWGTNVLTPPVIDQLCRQLSIIKSDVSRGRQIQHYQILQQTLHSWAGNRWEGSRVVRLIERAVKRIGWQWYQDRYKYGKEYPTRRYTRPTLPITMPVPSAPTVLPFHTFTTPLSAKQVRQISQRNALRISVSTLRSAWLPRVVYPPPAPPNPSLRVGYVSSDFNNHPLAHLMQSIFGLHNRQIVTAYCYATTSSDNSIHRQQIEREAPHFRDASSWTPEKLVTKIVEDGIHVLVNLNGYTRGAKNEIFAARPAPIHMSFMGFAGTLGAEWCDYVYADEISIPRNTLSPYRANTTVEDKLDPRSQNEDEEGWIYAENVIFSKSSFFCVDHKQSAPDSSTGPPPLYDTIACEQAWQCHLASRHKLRREIFPSISDKGVILGNFNQLYKIDPNTFAMYLRILQRVPNAILWLLRFPDVGETNLKDFARKWAGEEVASRVVFTDVASKGQHILRASVVDLFLDTPECNAHTTSADVVWAGTPVLTWGRWGYKMCSRMASSIMGSALPEGPDGDQARAELIVDSEEAYVENAVKLASGLTYHGKRVTTKDMIEFQSNGRVRQKKDSKVRLGHQHLSGSSKSATQTKSHIPVVMDGTGEGRLLDIRRTLWEGRWTSRLFDTKGWVNNLEKAYWKAWEKWESGEGGDIYM